MSTLNDLYQQEGGAVLDKIHTALGTNRKYLWQMATGRRRPSPELAREMVEAEPRLTLGELLFPPPVPKTAPTQEPANA